MILQRLAILSEKIGKKMKKSVNYNDDHNGWCSKVSLSFEAFLLIASPMIGGRDLDRLDVR